MPMLRTTEVDPVLNNEALEINLDLLEEKREEAAIREAKSKAKMERYYNSKVRSTSFKPGDLVYHNNDASRAEDTGKLVPKWEGPYKVTEALGKGAYELRDHDKKQLPRTWNTVCKPHLDKFVIVFINDIFVYSKDEEERRNHLKIILELLKKERFGVHVDPAKIKAIKNQAAPTTPMEVRQILRLAGYYRSDYDGEIRYLPGIANVVAHALSRKESNKPLHVRDLMMIVHNDLLKQIHEAQKEAMKMKNVKAKILGRLIKQIFKFCPDETCCFGNHVWLPRFGRLRDMVMHE
ncbi:hypothetical protein Tco_0693364 [Tanacetum coccineum]